MTMLREKILVIGPPGSGKSYSGLTIARCFPDSRFFIIDTDDSIPRMLATEFSDLKNITTFPCTRWSEYEEASKKIKKEAKENDWVMISRHLRNIFFAAAEDN